MKRKDFTFLSSDKKTNIHAIICTPKDKKYTKILQILHGMREYIEKYIDFMEYLATEGFMVVGHDYIGHGKSYINRDDRGYFGEPDPMRLLIKDIHNLRMMTQKNNVNIPYFMLGHSFGSFLLRSYITEFGNDLSGAIIMSTGFHPPCKAMLGMMAIKILACFTGWKYRTLYLKKLVEGKEMEKYDLTGKDPTNGWWTRDPEYVKKILSDSNSDYIYSINGYYAVFQAVNFSCDANNVARMRKDLPLLIISGKADIVGKYGVAVKQCYELLKSVGSVDVTLKLFEDYRHELLHELDKEKIYDCLKSWMESKCTDK